MATVAASSSHASATSSRSVWSRLVEPSAAVVGPERRTVRLLSTLSLLLVALSLPVVFSRYVIHFVTGEGQLGVSWTNVLSLVVMLVSYVLSRTRFHRIASLMVVSSTSVIVFASYALVLPTLPPAASETEAALVSVVLGFILMIVLLSVVLASLLLSKRGTIIVAVLNLIGIAALTATDGIRVTVGYSVLMFNLIISILIIVAMHHRDQLEAERSAALAKALQDAETANAALAVSVNEARAATAMAHEASRLKSEFLSNMSHELRTPLNAIVGFAEILLAGMSGPLSPDHEQKVTRIHVNSRRLIDLISDLLDLAKIEAGRVEVVHKPFSPQELAVGIKAQMESLAVQKGIGFEVTVDPAMPTALLGDAARIEQIAKNLLSNAIKFTKEGSVTLAVCRHEESRWQLSVTDTGIGIPPHALEYIFDEFRQVDGSSRREYGGTGLGLAITRNLTRIMGGDVRATSTIGKGSIFTVTLPLDTVPTNQ